MPRHPNPWKPRTANGDAPSPLWRNLFNIEMIEAVLHNAARSGKALSYAETLNHLGYDFSRPKMRALCIALGEVDSRARQNNEPSLAVLVVRASDGLPGAGWWTEKDRKSYKGQPEGPEAIAYIRRKQREAFKYWKSQKS